MAIFPQMGVRKNRVNPVFYGGGKPYFKIGIFPIADSVGQNFFGETFHKPKILG